MAKSFAAKGYRIALASRKPPSFDVKDSLHVTVDLAKPADVPNIFDTVKQKWGASPSVVVYNGKHDSIPFYSLSFASSLSSSCMAWLGLSWVSSATGSNYIVHPEELVMVM